LLHGQITGLGSFQDFIHVVSNPPVTVHKVAVIGHQPTLVCVCRAAADRGQAITRCESGGSFQIGSHERAARHVQPIGALAGFYPGQYGVEFLAR
jgi:hypothetical protein